MLQQFQAGGVIPSAGQTGTPNAPGGKYAEGLFTELNPQYYTLLKNNRVFGAEASNVAATTAFTGGAAGTPLFGIYNPANSGYDLVLLYVILNVRSAGTTTGANGFNFYLAQGTTAVTATPTTYPRNMYTGASPGGSVATLILNAANTGASASTLYIPSFSYGVLTASPLNITQFIQPLQGMGAVAPGNYLAYGTYGATAAGAIDATLVWAEIAV